MPYTKQEQAHIEAGRYHETFHRFCHESRYDWSFPDPAQTSSWNGSGEGPSDSRWSIPKYDPRLRHFPLYMQQMPKRQRQIQQDLSDATHQLSRQDRAAWLYIQGIRRYNIKMAELLKNMDLERKRRQVLWPCQLQVEIRRKPVSLPGILIVLNGLLLTMLCIRLLAALCLHWPMSGALNRTE